MIWSDRRDRFGFYLKLPTLGPISHEQDVQDIREDEIKIVFNTYGAVQEARSSCVLR